MQEMVVMNMGVDNITKGGVSPISPRIQPGQPAIGGPVIQTPDLPAKSSVQVNLEGFLRSQLLELAKAVANRSQLLESLPADVREAVQTLIQQTSLAAENLPQGMVSLLKSQRNLAEQLQTLGETLGNAAVLNGAVDSDMQLFLMKVAQQFAESSTVSPEQAAREMLTMLNRLMASEDGAPLNQEEAVKNLAENLLGKPPEDLSESEQRLLQQLVADFGGKIAKTLQQVVQLLPEQASSATMGADLENKLIELIKTLPPEIGQIAQDMLRDNDVPQKLANLAETLEKFAMINANSPKELQNLLEQTAKTFSAWSPLPPEQAADELLILTQRLLSNDPATEEIKQMIRQLSDQLPAMQPEKLTAKENAQLQSLLKNMTEGMPPQLQQAATLNNLPELPRLWALFTAAGAGQWKNVAPQDMEKAASALIDLAKAMADDPTAAPVLLRQTELLDSLPPELAKAVKESLNFSQGAARIRVLADALQPGADREIKSDIASGSQNAAPAAVKPDDVWINNVLLKVRQQLSATPLPTGLADNEEKTALIAATLQEIAETMAEVPANGRAQLRQAATITELPAEVAGLIKNLLQEEGPAAKLMNFAQYMADAGIHDAAKLQDFQTVLSKLAGGVFTAANPGGAQDEMSGSLLQIIQTYVKENVTTIESLQKMTRLLSVQLLGSDPSALPEKEQQLLQQLVKNLGGNLPDVLQQATPRVNSSRPQEIYTLLKAIETGTWRSGLPDNLQKAATTVQELAQSVQKSTGLISQKQADHSVLSFTTPLYFGEASVPYPAYVHIYQQQKEHGRSGQRKNHFETWMRVSLETENLGVVDTIFRLYDEDQLSVRVRINGLEAAEAFSDCASEIRKKLNDGKLNLAEFNINAV